MSTTCRPSCIAQWVRRPNVTGALCCSACWTRSCRRRPLPSPCDCEEACHSPLDGAGDPWCSGRETIQTFPVSVVRFTFANPDVQHEVHWQVSRSTRFTGGTSLPTASKFISGCSHCWMMDEGITAVSCKMDVFQCSG